MAGGGIALKALQWFVRGVQFCCSALVLSIYCYFLATLDNHNLHIDTHLRAVTGISGIATVYTIIGLVLLCCLAGFAFTSAVAIFLDVCFAAAFIYVAWVNRHGASSCNGYLDTPYGQGSSRNTIDGSDGFTALPSFRQACRMQTACLAVSIVAIFFFLASIGVEVLLVRHRRKEQRFGPGPSNNYTSGSGRKPGMFSWRRKKHQKPIDADNHLPEHTTPDQMRNSYNTEATAVAHPDHAAGYNKHGEAGLEHNAAAPANPYHNNYSTQQAGTTGPNAAGYQYGDGVYDRR